MSTASPSGFYQIAHNYNSGATRLIISSVIATVGVKKRHSFAYSGSTLRYFIDGTLVGTTTFDGLTPLPDWVVRLGYDVTGTSYRNGYISNLRISKIARTDTEMAYTGQLVPDEYTTYYSDMKESISTRPFVKVNGLAQNVVLAGDSPNQNAIVNGDFRLASRGTSFSLTATGNTPTFDGVIFYSNTASGTKTITRESFVLGQKEVLGATYYLRCNNSVAPTGQTFQYIQFRLEDVSKIAGGKYKLVFYARASLPNLPINLSGGQVFGTGGSPSSAVYPTIATNVLVKTSWTEFTFPVNFPSVAGKVLGTGLNDYYNISVGMPINAAFTLDIADIEIKPADAPDSFYRRDIQMQQQLMARFLQKLPANLQLRATNVATNTIDFEYRLPVTMRANPAISGTYAETTNWKVNNLAGTQTTGFALALLNTGTDRVGIRLTKTAHGLTDATLSLVTDILISAEL